MAEKTSPGRWHKTKVCAKKGHELYEALEEITSRGALGQEHVQGAARWPIWPDFKEQSRRQVVELGPSQGLISPYPVIQTQGRPSCLYHYYYYYHSVNDSPAIST